MTFCTLLTMVRAFFKINSAHNAAHTNPLSFEQDYETETECVPELNLIGRQGCQFAGSNLNGLEDFSLFKESALRWFQD